MIEYTYIGDELDLFVHAENWKKYYKKHIAPFIFGHVLEVGAGFGGTTQTLYDLPHQSWTCIEPDSNLAHCIQSRLAPAQSVHIIEGTLHTLDKNQTFDTILYIDVLEHIEDHQQEIKNAAHHLHPGGYLIVLAPAHQILFSPFDDAIGHFRRYNTQSLLQTVENTLSLSRLFYLDSAGLLASLANRIFLKQKMPTLNQVKIWDRYLVPISTFLDRITAFRLGKSIVGIWKKDDPSF